MVEDNVVKLTIKTSRIRGILASARTPICHLRSLHGSGGSRCVTMTAESWIGQGCGSRLYAGNGSGRAPRSFAQVQRCPGTDSGLVRGICGLQRRLTVLRGAGARRLQDSRRERRRGLPDHTVAGRILQTELGQGTRGRCDSRYSFGRNGHSKNRRLPGPVGGGGAAAGQAGSGAAGLCREQLRPAT